MTDTNAISSAVSAAAWPAGQDEVAFLARIHEWWRSPLGPSEHWPQSLKTAVDLALACNFPMIVLWGPSLVQIYNEAYRDLMGSKHPVGLGQPTKDCWPEVWHINQPIYEQVLRGETLNFEDQIYPITRYGYLEDAYFTLCYSPLRGDAGSVEGILVTVFETTERFKAMARLKINEARLSELFDQAPAIFALMRGPDHVYEMINPLGQKLVGQRDVIGKPLREALPEAVEQGFVEILDSVYRTGQPFVAQRATLSLAPAPGQPPQENVLDLVFQPLRQPDGSVDGIITFGVDVTDAQKAADALAASQAELRWTVDLSPHIPWTADPQGNILAFSDRWLTLTGLTREQAIGQGWIQVAHLEDIDLIQTNWNHALQTGEPYDVEHRIVLSNGEIRWMHSRALPRRDAAGHIIRWYGSTDDIHHLKMAEKALVQSEKLAAVGRLASSIAHEINNPLEAVTNLLYLARTSADSEEALSYIITAEAELGRVSLITNQTLRFHKQSTRQQAVTCTDLIGGALSIYKGRLSSAGISVEKRKRAAMPVTCFEGEIRQVLNNLIGNAIDATPREHGRLLIRSRNGTHWKTGRGGLILTIADNGSGMSSQTQKKIFEPFFTTKGVTGIGLGLWVSCEIVNRHHGSLRTRSTQRTGRNGTVFTLFLPFDVHPKELRQVAIPA